MFEVINTDVKNPIRKITVPEIKESLIVAIQNRGGKNSYYYTMSNGIDSKRCSQYQFNGIGFTNPRILAEHESKVRSILEMIDNGFRVFTCENIEEFAKLIRIMEKGDESSEECEEK